MQCRSGRNKEGGAIGRVCGDAPGHWPFGTAALVVALAPQVERWHEGQAN